MPFFTLHHTIAFRLELGSYEGKVPMEVSMAAQLQQLDIFVKEALQGGSTKGEIAKVLEGAGWTSEQITSASNAYSDASFPVPVPKPRPSLSAREAFLYLLMFSTLYYGAWNLGSLLFTFINRAFPDPTEAKYIAFYWDEQRWSTAAIIIAFPVFFFMARYIGQQITRNPLKRLSPVRRWLTHVTLFVSSTALLCDTTTLIYNLLGGDLTIRFVLKVLVVAAIAGSGFAYYLLDLRQEERE
jgi:hypothetical protein